MRSETVIDVEYREYFDLGVRAGRDAQQVMHEAELAGVRIRVTRIADALETAWYDAAYARGFLQATEPPISNGRWRRQPNVRRRRREW